VVDRAASHLDSAQSLYDLGYQLIDEHLPDIAACVLSRAAKLAPGEEAIVTELCSALEHDGRNDEACRVLRAEEALCATSFTCRYLLAFNSVLSGDLDAATQLVHSLQAHTDEGEAFMAGRIDEMLQRAKLARRGGDLGPEDLRGWHFVATGAVLLHLSPYGFDEGMRGRYAFTQDSPARCRLGLERLRTVLEAWEAEGAGAPSRLLGLPDRDSQILGRAASELLGLPLIDYKADLPGLIIAYDLSTLDPQTPPEIIGHRRGQVLFAHASCWTDPAPCAADLTTYLYQTQQTPWGERLRAGDGAMQLAPPDDAPPLMIAARIVAAELSAEEELPHDGLTGLVDFVRAVRLGASAFRETGRRSPLWEGSPVKSSRFI
jgi:hypothetical protein